MRRDAELARLYLEAEARAQVAETARIEALSRARSIAERRRTMAIMSVVAAVAMLAFMRMGTPVGALAFSISSMLVVWGIVDVVRYSGERASLRRRAGELQRQRDAARAVADEARRLQ